MPLFEVYIPAKQGSGANNVTVKVQATSWLLALRTGMKQLGDQGTALSSILVENQPDGSILVKDPTTRRIFRIRETSTEVTADDRAREQAAQVQAEQRHQEAQRLMAERDAAARALEEAKREAEAAKKRATAEHERAVAAQAAEQARARAEAEQRARAADEAARRAAVERTQLEQRYKTAERQALQMAEAAALSQGGFLHELAVEESAAGPEIHEEPEEQAGDEFDPNEVLADLFERTMDLYNMQGQQALEYIMDLAMDVVRAEAGSVILSDYNSSQQDMYFAVARGPVSGQIAKLRIPRGKGIVGFSIIHGCALAVNDVSKNPHFFEDISKKTGFPTRSLLCVPINVDNRTMGCIELVNKKGSDRWNSGEVSVLSFLAEKAGEQLLHLADDVDISDIQ